MERVISALAFGRASHGGKNLRLGHESPEGIERDAQDSLSTERRLKSVSRLSLLAPACICASVVFR